MKVKLGIKEGTSEDQIRKIVLKMKLAVTDDGFIFFNERFSGIELLGAALTLLATWQIIRRPARTAIPAPSRS